MMKHVLALGTFTVVGASVTGAGALALLGSDTMEVLTNLVLNDTAADCGGTNNTPAGTLTYAGTGSTNGENAMIAATQQISPMSRPLKASVCASNPNYRMNPVALDAISILVARREGTAGVVDSAYTAPVITDPTQKTCLGVKFSTGAPFNRIRAVFSGGDGTTATATGSAANCTSTFRTSILNNWTNFTSSTCGHAGNPIRHAFRRDDKSGTTDTFKSLVGVSGFCNGAATGLAGGNQDLDPVRRTCHANEQVCSPNGDLGVVLAISVPATSPYPGAGAPPDTQADRQARYANTEFHRLHQSLTLAVGATACRRADSTEQIGCLVAVSPYSTGFAGLEATKVSGATYLKVGNVTPSVKTIRAFGTSTAYPITRRLFVNDLVGNAAVTGDEAKALGCYTNRTFMETPAGTSKVEAAGFVTMTALPSDPLPAAITDQTCF
ncbi:MAG: hypothetical protein ACOY0T_20785 [Myxococcota bacterium]